ncbi:MAG: hypothetical protein UMV23_05685 [Halanaerobium sp.]|nr:hypothetical protein [Halanaerobium sp.]
MGRKIIAVDFDGTLVRDAFPDIGELRSEVVRRIKEEKEKGNIIIIWTCRDGEYLKRAVDYLKEHGVPFDYVNENYPELGFATSNKIYADEYWDDRAVQL